MVPVRWSFADGNHAYITGHVAAAVSWFTRDPITGALSYGSASDANYNLTDSDLGKTITVVAGYTDGGSTAESVASTATPPVSTPSLNDTNFQSAINLWFDNQAEANATYGHISDWNVSSVTYMANAFKDRTNFNEDISDWDISNAISTYRMFYGASTFNQNISNWNVGNVTDMRSMFQNASAFNQPIGDWNVSKVQLMFGIFAGASTFNQSIGDWNTTSVTNLHNAFNGATAFNQPLNNWNTSAVTTIYGIFGGTSNFNQPLEKWDTSSVDNESCLRWCIILQPRH